MSRRVEAILVTGVVVAVYGATRSGNHSETEDSVSYAVRARDEPLSELLEGTHIVYLAIGRGFASVLSALHLTEDTLLALQVLDMALGAAAVGGLWLLLRRVGLSRLAALAACGTVAFSYSYWHNAVEPEVYALSAMTLVAAFAAAWNAATAPRTFAFALLGLANGAAVLGHAVNVFFAVVAATAAFLAVRRAGASARSGLRWFGVYTISAASVALPVYAIAAVVHDLTTPAEFSAWFTERSGQPGDFGTIGPSNVAEGTVGGARAFIGGHFALSLEPVRSVLADRFPGKTFAEEQFLLHGFPSAVASSLIAVSLAAALLLAVIARQWLRRPALGAGKRALAILAVAWIVAYGLVLVWWDPLNIEMWYAVWLPAAVLLALPLDTLDEPSRRIIAVGVVGTLFIANLAGSALPQRTEERDFWRVKAGWYQRNTHDGDLVVSNGYLWSSYLRYLVAARVVDIEDLFREAESDGDALSALRRDLASVRGRVFVSGEVFDAFADRPAACIDAPRTCDIARVTARELRPECRLVEVMPDPHESVWRCPKVSPG